MGDIYPAQKINLVERPEWSDYDTAGKLGDLISENAWELVSQLECDDIVSYAGDVLSVGKKSRKWLTEEEGDVICRAFKDGASEIEGFSYLVRDAAQYAFEVAYLPNDQEIQSSIDLAVVSISETENIWEYEVLSEIAEFLQMSSKQFLRSILAGVYFVHTPGMYDRYLMYDPGGSGMVIALIEKAIRPSPKGVLDWVPALDVKKEDIAQELSSLFSELKEPVIREIFKRLKKEMEGVDIQNRFDFQKEWKKILAEKQRVKSVQKELKFLIRV